MPEDMPDHVKDAVAEIETTTKKGFDLEARLKNRGLRKSTITLFLDEEKGPLLGWAYDVTDQFNNVIGRAREGVIGDLDLAQATRDRIDADYVAAVAAYQSLVAAADALPSGDSTLAKEPEVPDFKDMDKHIAKLTKQRDGLIEELTKTGLKVSMRAVPPIIQKDMRRKAKLTIGVEAKKIPDDLADEYNTAFSAHLMSVMIQTITDNETASVNDNVTYEDAISLMDFLPPGQWARLDEEIGKLQFTDAISRSIENQEDFS